MTPTTTPSARRSRHGFTLVEVLVALGIVAIALMAGLRATGALTTNAQRQGDMLLAQLCAENELVKARLASQLPGVGDNSVTCAQAGREFTVDVIVRSTPNPQFRRVDAKVRDAANSANTLLRLTTIVGQF
ncbi:MAG TPA: type II secretion system minor pseudopilin GspI [Burkholderiaceae bacterium]